MFDVAQQVTVSRGQLTVEQIEILDGILLHHSFEPSSPYSTPETLAYACLGCGSVGVSETRRTRDEFIEHFDPQCCGLTVVFRSRQRSLVEPSKLIIVKEDD